MAISRDSKRGVKQEEGESGEQVKNLHNLWVSLAMTRDAVYRATKKELSEYGITPSQGVAMFVINALGDEATPTEIARRIFRQHHSIWELLIRMEKAGLVKEIRTLHKKNLKRYVLTEKGREMHRKSTQRKTVNRIFSVLTKEQQEQLKTITHILFTRAMQDLKDEISFLPDLSE